MKHETLPKVVEDLLAGRARIAAGWCQEQYANPRPDCLGGTAYCALGALNEAEKAKTWVYAALPDGRASVVAYNDDPQTTQADILSLFDRAIALALTENLKH